MYTTRLALVLLLVIAACGTPPPDAPDPMITPVSEVSVFSDGADLLIFDGYKSTTYRPAGLVPNTWYYLHRDGAGYSVRTGMLTIKDYLCVFRTQATAAIVQFAFEGRMWTYRSPQMVLSGGRSPVRFFISLADTVPPHITRPYIEYRFLPGLDSGLFDILWLDYDQQTVTTKAGEVSQGQLWLYSPRQSANYRVGDARSAAWLSVVGWFEPREP